VSGLGFQNRGVFVGRATELKALSGALDASGFVTLVGPGGVGKTRLAVEFLKRHDGDFVVHALWLDEISEASEIPARLIRTLGIASTGEGDFEKAIVALSGVKNSLVFIDNAEHVLAGVQQLIPELVRQKIPVFVTSQVQLGLPGETVVPVPQLSATEAKELLRVRAQLNESDLDSKTDELVAALDGLPLAIELAAARTLVLSPDQILTRLGSSNQVLGSLRASRHGTLDRTIKWSWDLLEPATKKIATTIALFDHALDPRLLDELWPEYDVVSLAQELESRFWLRVNDGPRGKTWSTLWAMRRFVRTRITDEEHALYEQRFCIWARAHLAEAPGWWAFLIPEGISSLKALMREGAYADGAVLLEKLFFGAFGGPHFKDVLDLAENLLNKMDRTADPVAWSILATKLSKGAFLYKSRHRAIDWSAPAVEVAPVGSTARLGAMAQHVLCLNDKGRREEAAELLKVAVTSWEEQPLEMSLVSGLLDVTSSLHEVGDFVELRRTATAILEIARREGNADAEARAWIHLSYASYDLGEFTRADEEIGNLNRLLALRHAHDRVAVGGAVAPLVALQLGRKAEAKAALIACEDVVRQTHNASLEFYVELAWAEWAAREEISAIRAHLDLALSSANTQASPKSVAHVRFLHALEDIASGSFETALLRIAALRRDGLNPAATQSWQDALDSTEWFCQKRLGTALEPPDSLLGELFAAVEAAICGDEAVLADLLDREPASAWAVPGLYLLRMDDVARRLPARISRRSGPRLQLEKNGRKFRVNQDAIQDISRRQALRKILVYLAEQQKGAEQVSVSVHDVIEAGWPDEKILHDAALTRVYTTMNRMRAMGLDDIIITLDDGYAIAPDVVVEWVDSLV